MSTDDTGTTERPCCAWCRAGGVCGIDQRGGPDDCAAYKMERGGRLTAEDVLRFQLQLAERTTQQIGGLMLEIERIRQHLHKPGGT